MSEPSVGDNPEASAAESGETAAATVATEAAVGEAAPRAATKATKVPAVRIPGPARGVLLLTLALLAVAAVVYLVIPKSSGQNAPKASGASVGNAAATSGAPAAGRSAPAGNSASTGGGNAVAPQPGTATGNGASQNSIPPSPDSPQPLKPSNPATVKSWSTGSGGAALLQVTTQSGNALQANAIGQYPAMLGYCHALATAVQGALNAAPIPDAAMEKVYLTSLKAFKQGAAGCVASITQHPEGVEDTVTDVNHPGLQRALSKLGVGIRDLYVATEALRKP